MLAIATGGSPASTGVYFDVSYDRSLYPPGVTSGPTGTAVIYDETVDIDPNASDGGGGLSESELPLDPARGNAPVYPHNYVRVNTIFEVIKAAGLRTAWSDKHLADEIVNGPSGKGVDDLYIPEIAAVNQFGVTITKSLELTEQYDDGKVQAIINEIAGYDHAGSNHVGVPAIFGMNFQAVSVAQRMNNNKTPQGKNVMGTLAGAGGYLDGRATPSPILADALDHTDAALNRILGELQSQGLSENTYIILTAKHGQAPIDPALLNHVSSAAIDNLVRSETEPLLISGDDAALIWLRDQSSTVGIVDLLLNNRTNLFIDRVLANESLTLHYPDPAVDPRTPDIIAIGTVGTIYSASSKIAEHGGFSDDDVHVPIIICNPKIRPEAITTAVETKQIAPTILQLLGLNPFALQAVLKEHTTVLPGFDAAFASLDFPPAINLSLTTSSTIQVLHSEIPIAITAGRAQTFVLETSTNLTSWVAVSTNSITVTGSTNVMDALSPPGSSRFYRVSEPL